MDIIAQLLDQARRAADVSPLIACLFTGREMPRFVHPMRLEPVPPSGFELDASFPQRYSSVIRTVPAAHDGAVMVGRSTSADRYIVRAWSYRLLPPPVDVEAEANRGSAYHSALAMSLVDAVDAVHVVYANQYVLFRAGRTTRVT